MKQESYALVIYHVKVEGERVEGLLDAGDHLIGQKFINMKQECIFP